MLLAVFEILQFLNFPNVPTYFKRIKNKFKNNSKMSNVINFSFLVKNIIFLMKEEMSTLKFLLIFVFCQSNIVANSNFNASLILKMLLI